MKDIKLTPGTLVYFSTDVKPFKVRACDDRFAICTKPFNLKKTYFYTIIDLDADRRGPDDRIFHCYDLTKDRECTLMLRHLQRGKIELSQRRGRGLDILRIVEPKSVTAPLAD